jgi:hypothetical protein
MEEPGGGFGDPGAVDQGVQPPEGAHAFFDERARYALVVGGPDYRDGSPTRSRDCRDGLLHGSSVTPVDNHAGAEIAEQFGHRTTDTAAAAGYHRAAPVQ